METLNMRTVSLSWVTTQIRHQLEDEDYTPVILIGKSGIGKTESIRDLADELQIGFCEVRLSHYQESDLIGLPYITEEHTTAHAASDILPDENDKGQGILLLDEVTSAPRSMRSAVYQLMDVSRGLGKYRLPEKWIIVACGNGPDDGGDFRGIEPAFLSRGLCWRVEEDIRVWKQWAIKHQAHPAVIAFLSFRPEMLHVMDLDRPFDMIACPRNWTKLSGALINAERRAGGRDLLSPDDLESIAEGCVGTRCGAAFAAFYHYKKMIIDPEDIVHDRVAPAEMRELSEEALYLTAQTLVKYMADVFTGNNASDEKDIQEKFGHLFRWIVELGNTVRLDTAITIIQDLTLSAGDELRRLILMEEFDEICPEFAEFATEHYIIL